jgi:hypothetical protein
MQQQQERKYEFELYYVGPKLGYMVLSRLSARDASKLNFKNMEVLCDRPKNLNSPRSQGIRNMSSVVEASWMQLDLCSVPTKLFAPLVTELSVHYDTVTHTWVAVSLQAYQYAMQLCRADQITGPWHCRLVQDSVPSPWNDPRKFITYAAKVHPELSPAAFETFDEHNRVVKDATAERRIEKAMKVKKGAVSVVDQIATHRNATVVSEMVISFVPNAVEGFPALFAEEYRAAYTPKFVVVKLISE